MRAPCQPVLPSTTRYKPLPNLFQKLGSEGLFQQPLPLALTYLQAKCIPVHPREPCDPR